MSIVTNTTQSESATSQSIIKMRKQAVNGLMLLLIFAVGAIALAILFVTRYDELDVYPRVMAIMGILGFAFCAVIQAGDYVNSVLSHRELLAEKYAAK